MKETSLQNGPYFTTSEVAAQVGVTPATIRNWEKAGLFSVERTPKGYRKFTFSDIDLLKRIKTNSIDRRISMNGLRILSTTFDDYAGPKQNQAPPVFMSSKWRAYRLEKNYRLCDVADAIGISPAYLSRIEQGKANASLKILEKIADFYGENLLFYLESPDKNRHLIPAGQGELFDIGEPGIKLQRLIDLTDHTMDALMYTVLPGSGRTNPHSHSGEEYVYMLFGKLQFTLGENSYELKPGDSLCFLSSETHSWINDSQQVAVFLWVYTPLIKM